MPNLDAALERIRSTAPSTTVQGLPLRANVPGRPPESSGRVPRHICSLVGCGTTMAGRDGPDSGIDLVAEDRDGNEWAIQCKNYFNTTGQDHKT